MNPTERAISNRHIVTMANELADLLRGRKAHVVPAGFAKPVPTTHAAAFSMLRERGSVMVRVNDFAETVQVEGVE